MTAKRLGQVEERIVRCEACPRLVAHRQAVARKKRRAYRDEVYWGRPVPGFGDPAARLVVVGLAPGAHGANRTGRVFTGDCSGDFLFAALHRAGLASQAQAVARDDGLRLQDTWVTLAARCVPPDNKPSPRELSSCAHFLDEELAELPCMWALLALGAIAWHAVLGWATRQGVQVPSPRPKFAHGAVVRLGRHTLVGSYHVSQQNTQTGRLTPRMFDAVLRKAQRASSAATDLREHIKR